MTVELTTDPRAIKVQNYVRTAGLVGVAAVSSIVVVVAGASLAAAGLAMVAGLVLVNFVVPVAARSVALWRVKALTQLTETFSEETIREDEQKEGERIKLQEQSYVQMRAALEAAEEGLRQQLPRATDDERTDLNDQILEIRTAIGDAETALKQKKVNFIELQRLNEQFIAKHRAALAMQSAKGAERTTEELQRIKIARAAIISRMREAKAGKTVEAMDLAIQKQGAAHV